MISRCASSPSSLLVRALGLKRPLPEAKRLLRTAVAPSLRACPGLSSSWSSSRDFSTTGFANASANHASPASPGGTTVDASELRKFEAIAAQWWRPDGPFAGLHQMNPVRIQLIKRAASEMLADGVGSPEGLAVGSPLRGMRILDIGCGGGILSEALARLGAASVTGIDAAAANVKAAQAHANLDAGRLGKNLRYRNITVEALLEEARGAAREDGEEGRRSSLFDIVVCSEVLEHVSDTKLFLSSACSLIRPGGALVITTINRTLKAFFGGVVAAEYVARLVPAGTHEWAKFLRPEEIQEILQDHGQGQEGTMVTCETVGLKYNPLLGKWSIADGRSSNNNNSISGGLGLLGGQDGDLGINYGLIARKLAAK